MKSFAVSVVIPAHNRAATLGACLRSVLGQTRPPDEVIVVDDRSTDETRRIVESFSGSGVRYHRLESGFGAQAARNAGVRLATFPWIAFQDSDDLWRPDKLALQLQALAASGRSPMTVIHADGLRRNAENGLAESIKLRPFEGRCRDALLFGPGPMFQAMLTSKEAIARAGWLDERCPAFQEWDTALRLSAHCTFVHLHKPLFEWVWHAGDRIGKSVGRSVDGYLYILEQYRAEMEATFGARHVRRAYLEQAGVAMRGGEWTRADIASKRVGPCFSASLVRMMSRWRLAPRGSVRLLRALA